jgi:hypothetical protein
MSDDAVHTVFNVHLTDDADCTREGASLRTGHMIIFKSLPKRSRASARGWRS